MPAPGEARAAHGSMVPMPFRVLKRRRETRDTFTIEMTAANGVGPFAFGPGQFNMLYTMGKGEVPISISGDPDDPHALVHTVRAVGKRSRALCDLAAGSKVGVRGPFGS